MLLQKVQTDLTYFQTNFSPWIVKFHDLNFSLNLHYVMHEDLNNAISWSKVKIKLNALFTFTEKASSSLKVFLIKMQFIFTQSSCTINSDQKEWEIFPEVVINVF